MAFFKLDNEEILEAPNFVYAPTYTLLKEQKELYEFPVDGWYWFETIEEAKKYFNIEDKAL